MLTTEQVAPGAEDREEREAAGGDRGAAQTVLLRQALCANRPPPACGMWYTLPGLINIISAWRTSSQVSHKSYCTGL